MGSQGAAGEPETNHASRGPAGADHGADGHFSDRLLRAIEAKGAPVCVGIDPVAERLPSAITNSGQRLLSTDGTVDAIYEFCAELIDAVADIVPAVKFQSACFERYRHDGVEALFSLIEDARSRDLIVIFDGKRGDIGLSAEHYAASIFQRPADFGGTAKKNGRDRGTGHEDSPLIGVDPTAADSITINPYFGTDGIDPFCRNGRGAFALVRTSNPGGTPIQQVKLESGETFAEFMAARVHEMGQAWVGREGYSDLGAVVGATHPSEINRLRAIMPQTLFLVPGFGAQGGSADDVTACFNRDGRGAIITASRSVIYAFEHPERIARSASAAADRRGSAAAATPGTPGGDAHQTAAGSDHGAADRAMAGSASDSPRWVDHVAAAASAFADEIREILAG
ncbi:MAG: orotidine-5'-phosphate decarboxylase [Planctomycetota bacterium]